MLSDRRSKPPLAFKGEGATDWRKASRVSIAFVVLLLIIALADRCANGG